MISEHPKNLFQAEISMYTIMHMHLPNVKGINQKDVACSM